MGSILPSIFWEKRLRCSNVVHISPHEIRSEEPWYRSDTASVVFLRMLNTYLFISSIRITFHQRDSRCKEFHLQKLLFSWRKVPEMTVSFQSYVADVRAVIGALWPTKTHLKETRGCFEFDGVFGALPSFDRQMSRSRLDYLASSFVKFIVRSRCTRTESSRIVFASSVA